MVKFQKHVKRGVREYLKQQLKEYESKTQMSKEERLLLHEWVSTGRSPYEMGTTYTVLAPFGLHQCP